MKTMRVVGFALLILISCKNRSASVVPAQWMKTDFVTITPKPAPYWKHFPLDSQPEGGW